MTRHDQKVILTPEQELAKLIRAQRADDTSRVSNNRQRFTDQAGQRVYTMSLDGMEWSPEVTEWEDPTWDAVEAASTDPESEPEA